jgi:DNA repair protein RadA/Sms
LSTEVIAGALRAPQEEGPRTDLTVAAAGAGGNGGAAIVSGFGAAGRLLDVAQARHEPLPVSDELAWLTNLLGQIVQGSVFLVGGPPGGNKSTLARQIALDLARQGHTSLMILTEETPARLKAAILRMAADWPPELVRHALSHIHVESNLSDWSLLPGYFARSVLAPGGQHHGVKFLVLDSIQGSGIAGSAGAKWRGLYEFASLARSAGVTVLMVSHVTKAGNTAGPKATEHNSDVVLALRKAGKGRFVGVLKNRFGPEQHKLIPLEVDAQRIVLEFHRGPRA